MKTFHIVFYKKTSDRIATGKNYKANQADKAYKLFQKEYPTAEFLYLASEEMLNRMNHRKHQ